MHALLMNHGLTRRRLLRGAALLAAAAIVRTPSRADAVTTQQRPVPPFDSVVWHAIGLLVVEQRAAASVSVSAEAQLLPKILTEVRQGRLHVTLAPGRLQTQQPLRVVVGVPALRSLHTRGAGSVQIGTVATPTLDLDLEASGDVQVDRLEAGRLTLRMGGSGDVSIAQGRVEAQQIVIAGSGQYLARHLASRRASVRIDGSGNAELAASDELVAQISGSGQIAYRGEPALRQQITGAGSVERLGA